MTEKQVNFDDQKYQDLQTKKFIEWEALCGRCGACCGSIDDPCEHLSKMENGPYVCSFYENRLGLHKTKNGKTIECVPIRNILHLSWPGDQCCGYKKVMQSFPNA